MLRKIISGQIRHLLGSSGAGFYGYLLALGASPTDIEAIISGAIAVVMALWSIYDKYKADKEKEKALMMPPPPQKEKYND